MKATEGNACSGWEVNGGFEKFENEDMYFKNATAVEVLEEFMGYRMPWETNENRNYGDWTKMHQTAYTLPHDAGTSRTVLRAASTFARFVFPPRKDKAGKGRSCSQYCTRGTCVVW